MGEDPQSLESHGFPQISQLVLHSIKKTVFQKKHGLFLLYMLCLFSSDVQGDSFCFAGL